MLLREKMTAHGGGLGLLAASLIGSALLTTSASAETPNPDKLAQLGPQAPAMLAPVTYHPDLTNTPFTDGDGVYGITDSANIGDPATWEYYRFCAVEGSTVTIETHRLTSAMDPAQQVCLGTTDDSDGITAGGSCGPDMTYIAWDDDNNGIPHGVGGFFADPRTVFVAPATGEYTLGVHDFIPAGAPPEFEVHIDGVIPCTLYKDIVDGNDVDADGAIDKVVEVGIESAAEYSFSINYNNPDGPTVVILDTVPAEWRVNNVLENGVLYFSEDLNDGGLWILDTATGAAYAVGISGVTSQTVGLALSDDPGVLWGSKPFDMLAISKDGSGAAVIGNAVAEGLTYNPDNGKLYGAINGEFFEVSTGDFTTLTPLAAPGNDIEGLAYAGGGLIYGLSSFSGPRGYLYSYDIGSDTWTEIGFTGVEFSEAGLAYDAASDLLYAKGDQDSILYAIDPSDATATPIGDTGIAEGGGLTFDGAGLNCEFEQANKGKKDDKSATKITCWPAADSGSVVVDVEARCHGNRNNETCRPTSCGALYLNDGAAAYELDEYGDPLYPPIAESNALCLAAVEDLDGDGLVYDGTGDEDADGALDYEEACGIGTDPCNPDTDGDGVLDGADECPLEGDMGFGVDAVGCPNVCPCWANTDLLNVTAANHRDDFSCGTQDSFEALIQNVRGSTPDVEGGFGADSGPWAGVPACFTRDFPPYQMEVSPEVAEQCKQQIFDRCAEIGFPVVAPAQLLPRAGADSNPFDPD